MKRSSLNATLSRCAVPVELHVVAGPHLGRTFAFERRDSFLVGRDPDCHLQLTGDDRFFSRRHFLLETHSHRCRVIDLGSRNGTFVNGQRILIHELHHGDELRAGHTVFRLKIANRSAVVQRETPAAGLVTLPQAAEPTTSEWSPPGYALHEIVGEGTMGVVYRATRLRDNRTVAIKVMKTVGAVNPRQVDRFQREAAIVSRLRHRNIVRCRESGSHDGRLYLVLDWIDGSDLASWIETRGPLPIRMAVRVVSQLLSALASAHEAGYVHRDVKPANILVSNQARRRRVKLADFGLARAYERSKLAGATMTGEIGGTPAFMPPEQVSHYRNVGPAADQYAAAATLYVLLTGKLVYDLPMSLGDQLVMIVTQRPIPIRQRRPDIPAGLAAVIEKALSRQASDRYADVKAFQLALQQYAFID